MSERAECKEPARVARSVRIDISIPASIWYKETELTTSGILGSGEAWSGEEKREGRVWSSKDHAVRKEEEVGIDVVGSEDF